MLHFHGFEDEEHVAPPDLFSRSENDAAHPARHGSEQIAGGLPRRRGAACRPPELVDRAGAPDEDPVSVAPRPDPNNILSGADRFEAFTGAHGLERNAATFDNRDPFFDANLGRLVPAGELHPPARQPVAAPQGSATAAPGAPGFDSEIARAAAIQAASEGIEDGRAGSRETRSVA